MKDLWRPLYPTNNISSSSSFFFFTQGKLKNEKELVKQLEIQIKDLTKKNDDLKSENEGIRIAAQLSSEEQSQSMINSHQEEIASLQHIYQGVKLWCFFLVLYSEGYG